MNKTTPCCDYIMTTKPWNMFQPKKNNGGKNPNCRLPFMQKTKTQLASDVSSEWPHCPDNCDGLLRIPACKHLFYLPLTPEGKNVFFLFPNMFLFAASKYSSTNFFNAWILSGNTAGIPSSIGLINWTRCSPMSESLLDHIFSGIWPSRRFVFVYVANVKTLIFWGCLPVILLLEKIRRTSGGDGSWNPTVCSVLAPFQVVSASQSSRFFCRKSILPSTWLFQLLRWSQRNGYFWYAGNAHWTSKKTFTKWPTGAPKFVYCLCHIHQQFMDPTWMALKISDSINIPVRCPLAHFKVTDREIWKHIPPRPRFLQWCHHIP